MPKFLSNGTLHLTLTSVVFEYNKKFVGTELNYNLTLTSVVFEFSCDSVTRYVFSSFNFNKCCI